MVGMRDSSNKRGVWVGGWMDDHLGIYEWYSYMHLCFQTGSIVLRLADRQAVHSY